MTQIIGTLDLRKHSDELWKLLSPIEYQFDSGRTFQVQKGFVLDLGSIHRLLQPISLPSIGSVADLAWVFHDGCYAAHRAGSDDWSRKQADAGMRELLLFLGVNTLIAHSVYVAVRGGALMSWMNPDERDAWDATENHEFMDQ